MAISRISFESPVQAQSIPNVNPVPQVSSVQESDVKYTLQKEDIADIESKKEEIDNAAVIAESADGDLLTGELKSSYTPEEKTTVIAETEDGRVSKIEKVPADEELITDLTGYTKSQVEQLYREGRISRYNYEKNMQRREELQQEVNPNPAADDSQFISNMSQLAEAEKSQGVEAQALVKAADNGRTDIMLDVFASAQKL